MVEVTRQPFKLAVVNSHPIQYFAPLYRRLAQESEIDLAVFFCSRQGLDEYIDQQFQHRFRWDVALLEGYRSLFLRNLRSQDKVSSFFGLVNLGIIPALWRGRYDALWVHGHNSVTYLLAMFSAKALGIPVLMRCETHTALHRAGAKRALRRPIMTFLYTRVCAACLPIGTRNREFYRAHGVAEDRLFDVPYTVDNAFFIGAADRARPEREGYRAALGLPVDAPLILYTSKFIPRKRPLDLVKSYELVRARGKQACLVLVGTGPEEERLRTYVDEHQIPDVFFLGFRNQSELPAIYALSDVFVLPAENEPWGLVINEVMCAGLPIVATYEIGAVVDLVHHGDNGLLYSTGDIDELTAHLEILITDADLRRLMGERSRAIIESWDIERCVQGVHDALMRVHPAQPGAHSEQPAGDLNRAPRGGEV